MGSTVMWTLPVRAASDESSANNVTVYAPLGVVGGTVRRMDLPSGWTDALIGYRTSGTVVTAVMSFSCGAAMSADSPARSRYSVWSSIIGLTVLSLSTSGAWAIAEAAQHVRSAAIAQI